MDFSTGEVMIPWLGSNTDLEARNIVALKMWGSYHENYTWE